MANAYGFSLGQVYQDVDAIKSARLRRQQMENVIAEQERYASDRDRLEGARADAVGGDFSGLVTMNPGEAVRMKQFFDSMSADEAASKREEMDAFGKMAMWVLDGGAEAPQRYAQVRASIPPDMAAQMPEEYDENALRFRLALLSDLADLMEDRRTQNEIAMETKGKIAVEKAKGANAIAQERESGRQARQTAGIKAGIDFAAENQKAAIEAAGGGELPGASDSNAIYRQAVQLFGGLMDEQGNIRALDPQNQQNAQAVAAEASRIYASGGVTHAEAVQRAYAAFVRAQGGGDPQGDVPQGGVPQGGAQRPDPLGLGGFFGWGK